MITRRKAPPVREVNPIFQEWVRRELEPATRPRVVVLHAFGAVADTTERIRHRLGTVPTGFTVIQQSKAASVYRDATMPAWDRFYLYLKSSAASLTVTLEVF